MTTKETLLSLLAIGLAGSMVAATPTTTRNTTTTAPDNTQVNERDYQTGTLTAEDQARGSTADVDLTRRVRQELMKDSTLSTDAQNVKIITLGGVVTLRGPVANAAEKQKIDQLTKKTAGVKKVDNQLEVKTGSY